MPFRSPFVATLLFAAVAAHTEESLVDRTLIVTHDRPGVYRPFVITASDAEPGGSYSAVNGNVSVPMTATPWGIVAVLPPELETGTHSLTIEEVSRRSRRKGAGVVIHRANANTLEVHVDGDFVTRFHHDPEERKPFLWPIKGPGSASVTRDWPMGERDATRDHPHHTSFWTAHGDLNGADYWEYGSRTGWQRVVTLDHGSGAAAGWIRATIVWEDKDRTPVISETRTYTFYATPEHHRLVDVTVEFTAAYGDVQFGDTKEGGLVGLRMNDRLRERGGSGTVTTSAGAVGAKNAWGKPAAWCDYSGTLEDIGPLGITVMDHPTSFRHPTHWHVRDYGLVGANPFGYSYFYDGEKNGEYTLSSNEKMTFKYRIYLHAGDVDEAEVATYYEAFATPPNGTLR